MGRKGEVLPSVTVVINSDVDDVFAPNKQGRLDRVIFVDPSRDEIASVSTEIFLPVCKVGASELKVAASLTSRKLKLERDRVRSNLVKTISSVNPTDQKIATIIAQAKIRLIFLINTLGGCISAEGKLIGYAKIVKDNGGEVWAYGRKDVCSAGAMVFMAADPHRRRLTSDSELFFHLSSGARKDDNHNLITPEMKQERIAELEMLKRLLQRNSVAANPRNNDLVKSIELSDQATPVGDDVSLSLDAQRAKRYLNVSCPTLDQVRAEYRANVGGRKVVRSLLYSTLGQPIHRFFT